MHTTAVVIVTIQTFDTLFPISGRRPRLPHNSSTAVVVHREWRSFITSHDQPRTLHTAVLLHQRPQSSSYKRARQSPVLYVCSTRYARCIHEMRAKACQAAYLVGARETNEHQLENIYLKKPNIAPGLRVPEVLLHLFPCNHALGIRDEGLPHTHGRDRRRVFLHVVACLVKQHQTHSSKVRK